ncbi:MAG: UvrD-helicase domain-containing protein [Proteobacteria bacterium]|nr:UvrD-helicase domain-containing protein [Pseudomonadota bacterium]
MEYIADLHIHSPFSRATSKLSDLPGLYSWAQIKGINLIGTGDFTHPGWFSRIKDLLEPAEPGFFKLKDENVPQAIPGTAPEPIPVRFVLSAEISSIYKRHDKVRKVHNIIFAPDLESAERINAKLASIGNIESDGRPILGLDSRNLLEIVLEKAPEGFLVPAHIWTPWFSLFGSKSGFDAIEDCFGDLTGHIFALETGLSSDPDMNRMISALDRFSLISNSDCHSPSKLGREANIFTTSFDFFHMREALKDPQKGFKETIEFYPEEGKYHMDGHRKCQVCLEPLETRKINAVCPVCGKPLTVGVAHRVMELADRDKPYYAPDTPGFKSLIPLAEVLGEILGCGPATKGVMTQYAKVISRFGSEFNIFFKTPVEDLKQFTPVLAEAIQRIRENKVIRKPGFDGEFGVIKVFEEGELDSLAGQIALFTGKKPAQKTSGKTKTTPLPALKKNCAAKDLEKSINPEQRKAITSKSRKIVVTAGPGTGKTFTLVERIKKQIADRPSSIHKTCAITFTNRAASEMKERLEKEIGTDCQKIFIGTFHRFCLDHLRKDSPELTIVGDETRNLFIRRIFPDWNKQRQTEFISTLQTFFEDFTATENAAPKAEAAIICYLDELERQGAIDLDAVIPFFVNRLKSNPALRTAVSECVGNLYVDEFQDINKTQYELVLLLAGHAEVFVIGDPDQAIYGFRGSDLEFFFRFSNLPETEKLKLCRNYRSAAGLIEAASTLISHNTRKEDSRLHPESCDQGFIEYFQAPTARAEAEFVVKRIEQLMGGISHFSMESGRGGDGKTPETSFGDIAVLYRLTRLADDLAEALERRGIPFQLIGGTPFFMKPEIRPLYYFIQAAAGSAFSADFTALLKSRKGVGNVTIKELEKLPLRCDDFFAEAASLDIPREAKALFLCLESALKQLKTSGMSMPEALINALHYLEIPAGSHETKRLLELAGVFGKDLHALARHLEQNARATVYDERAEAVALMTTHAAKGLEFPYVFIAGLEEGLLPYNYGDRICDIEEERRLFYVGCTRAKNGLILTSSATRMLFGKNMIEAPSRFIGEIPSSLLTVLKTDTRPKKAKENPQMKLF